MLSQKHSEFGEKKNSTPVQEIKPSALTPLPINIQKKCINVTPIMAFDTSNCEVIRQNPIYQRRTCRLTQISLYFTWIINTKMKLP
jgi:hypothetical protein